MKTILNSAIIIAASTLLLTTSCKKGDDNSIPGKFSKGILISNEGPFMDGSGTVSFYDPEYKTIENRIFETTNNRPLGNIVQSVAVFDGKAYIVVNNAGKVEVVDAGTFESEAVIEGLTSPRYFLGINNGKAYISDWSGEIAIIDLNTYTKTGAITAGASPDQMLVDGTRVWVINSAGWSSDSTVTLIDTQTDNPLQTIVVGDNPAGIVKDANGKIWVMCGGISDWANPANNTNGSLVRIDPMDFSIETIIEFQGSDFGPRLAINGAGNMIYYSFLGSIYAYEISSGSGLKSGPIINKPCYALGIDPLSGEIYFSDPIDYAQPGVIYRYNASGSTLLDSINAGIIPGDFLFLN
jgi:YVTN family beta-propeller protein